MQMPVQRHNASSCNTIMLVSKNLGTIVEKKPHSIVVLDPKALQPVP